MPDFPSLQSKSVKWEYKVVPVTLEVHAARIKAWREGKRPEIDSVEQALNKYGEEGWELVTVQTLHWEFRGLEHEQTIAYFKRKKQ